MDLAQASMMHLAHCLVFDVACREFYASACCLVDTSGFGTHLGRGSVEMPPLVFIGLHANGGQDVVQSTTIVSRLDLIGRERPFMRKSLEVVEGRLLAS